MSFIRNNRSSQAKLELLRAVPAFAGCTDRELTQAAQHVDEWTVEAGAVLTREGAPAHEAFLVIEGRATVSIDDEVVAELGPNDLVGEMAMLDRSPRSATVVAASPMRLLVIGPAAFGDFAAQPFVAKELARQLTDRLRRADGRHAEI